MSKSPGKIRIPVDRNFIVLEVADYGLLNRGDYVKITKKDRMEITGFVWFKSPTEDNMEKIIVGKSIAPDPKSYKSAVMISDVYCIRKRIALELLPQYRRQIDHSLSEVP